MCSIVSKSCSPLQLFKENPVRGGVAVALITALAIAAILIATQPVVLHFFTTTPGHWTIGGMALVTVLSSAFIFSPLCTQKTEDENDPAAEEVRKDLIAGNHATKLLLERQPNLAYDEPEVNDDKAIPEKFFKTQEFRKLHEGNEGDYSLLNVGWFQLISIKNRDGILTIPIIESKRCPGLYRLLQEQGGGVTGSRMLFSKAQISAMMRVIHKPTREMRVSRMTSLIPRETGMAIFTNDDHPKEHFFVDRRGVFVPIPLSELMEFIKSLAKKEK